MNSATEKASSAEEGRRRGNLGAVSVVAISTLVFWVIAHLYRFTNSNFAHDALMVVQDDVLWQVSLGRFLQPAYVFVRGAACAPMLIGVLQLAFLAVAGLLIVRLLGIRSRIGIAMTCGIVVTNASIALTNATYLPWADIFALTLVLNAAGVCVVRRSVPCAAIGACLYAAAMGLYQPYFAAAVVLSMLLVIRELVFGAPLRDCGALAARLVGALALGIVVYFLLCQVALQVCGVGLSSDYNSLSSAWDFGRVSIIALLAQTWLFPITYMARPETVHALLCCCCVVAVVVVALAGCAHGVRRSGGDGGPARAIAVVVLVALLPFGAGIVYFISKGTIHSLMLWQLHLVYVFGIMVWDREIGQATNAVLARLGAADETGASGETGVAGEVEAGGESGAAGKVGVASASASRPDIAPAPASELGVASASASEPDSPPAPVPDPDLGEEASRFAKRPRMLRWETFAAVALCLPIAVVIACNVAYSNDAYLKKDLEYDATMSIATRIMDRIEQKDGYVPGETPVAFVGRFNHMQFLRTRPGLTMHGTGLGDTTSITYMRHDDELTPDAHLDARNTLENYFTYVLAYPVNRVGADEETALAASDEVKAMPSFPAKGSVKYVDDVLVVKLSSK